MAASLDQVRAQYKAPGLVSLTEGELSPKASMESIRRGEQATAPSPSYREPAMDVVQAPLAPRVNDHGGYRGNACEWSVAKRQSRAHPPFNTPTHAPRLLRVFSGEECNVLRHGRLQPLFPVPFELAVIVPLFPP